MRIRTVKPDFWKNEHIARLDDFTQLLALGLLNYADDEGYFNANPKLIQADIFPLRDVSGRIPVSVTHLSNQGFLKLYQATDGRTYGHIVNFLKHQVINKPKESKIKALCTAEQGVLHLSGSDTVSLPYGIGTGNREGEQGTGRQEGEHEGAASAPPQPAEKRKPREIPTLEQWMAASRELHPDWPESDTRLAWEHYEKVGWKSGRNPIQKWRMAIGTCYRNYQQRASSGHSVRPTGWNRE